MKTMISEFQPNPIGADPMDATFELSGVAGASFFGTIISIESDPANVGVVDHVASVSGIFDANGLLTVLVPDLENPSFTVALVDAFTGSVGDDLDVDDDGFAEVDLSTVGITTVFDAIGIPDASVDVSFLYGAQLGGIDFDFTGDEPRLVFRSGSTGDWFAVNDPDNAQVFDVKGTEVTSAAFDTDPTLGTDTFGSINPSIRPAGTFDLQITEIWSGNDQGSDLTEDWFELTNTGTVAWVAATDGDLYFDDDSADPAAAERLMGIESIAPGESVIFIDAEDITDFETVWGSVRDLSSTQIGTYAGPGLSGGGDGVTVFAEGVETLGDGVLSDADQLDFETYPDAAANPGQSFDVPAQQFSGDLADQSDVVTTAPNDAGESAVGSPGSVTLVTPPASAFTLELLHITDQEASTGAIIDAPNLSAVVNALRAQDLDEDGIADNTLFLSSGDAFIPGVFFSASETVFGAEGIADIQIQNELGIQAIALGNHEFDRGPSVLAGLIDGSAGEGNLINGVDFAGTAMPYLSTNLDFSAEVSLATLEVAGGGAPIANTITSSVVLDVNGENIGVIGATTPTLSTISSTGDVLATPQPFDGTPTPEQLDALASEIQMEVDALKAADPTLDKIVLLAHMQRLDIELGLAERLTDVDIIVAGGSNTRLFDDNDRARAGDSDQGQYPQFVQNAGGTTTAVVNTDGSYKYVGRLVIDFDADGNIIPGSYDQEVSGAYATDDQGVAALGAGDLIDPEIQAIVDAIEVEIVAAEGNVFGVSDVFLNGNRSGIEDATDTDGVRTQETNLGNLTADANLAAAQAVDSDVVVSIKNGGGIRASIGETVVLPGDTTATRLPNDELLDGDGNVIKPDGGISQNDIQTALAFNNSLSLLTVTKAELVAVLEHGISAIPGVAGQFPQVSGVKFSYDPNLEAGARILNAVIEDGDGNVIAELVRDGNIVGAENQEFRIVTLNFLAGGGDGYPFPTGPEAMRVDLNDLDGDGADDGATGIATFANDGTEQDALAEFLAANHAEAATAYDEADAGRDTDGRIQNLNFREDTVIDDNLPDTPVASGEVTFAIAAEFEGEGGEGASEVVAHEDGVFYVTNGTQGRIDVFTLPMENSAPQFIDLTGLEGFDSLQSVAVKNGIVAVAISRAPEAATVFGQQVVLSQPGFVALFEADTLTLISTVDVGNLPDQLTFNADGSQLLVAGEGEKNEDSDQDDNPIGTVAVIDVTDPSNPSANIIDFTQFNGLEDAARSAGIRLQEGVSIAEDFEPEYIAVSPDGTIAFVSLQENNAIAKIDLATGDVVDVFGLGIVEFGQTGLDPLDDGSIDIRTVDNLVGLRMPDAIASAEINGRTYVLTANEGDSRGFDEDRVENLVNEGKLDPALVNELLAKGLIDTNPDIDVGIERLQVSTTDGDTDGDGDIDVIHTFSSRSFSIFDADGTLVFDSGSQFEQIIADLAPERFNDDDGQDGENRSDAKGPEPEAIAVGEVGGRMYAFIGLERDSGIMIYNIDDPANARFTNYIPPSHVDNTAAGDVARHGPEVITFIAAEDSTTGEAQIAISYEVSGTTVVYDLPALNPIVAIPEIQGAGHVSAFAGRTVTTTGIVTAVDFNGYYLQDAIGDGDTATSDAIFVFTGNGVAQGLVAVGDEVTISGEVSEFIPGGASSGNLSTTQISASEAEVLSQGNTVAATIIGAAGRTPPNASVISPDETPVNLLEEPGTFNPEQDGIDFYESLEGMLVTVDNPVAISATNRFDETWIVADNGANVTGGGQTGGLNDRGALVINADADGLGDLNPERIQIQYDAFLDLVPEGFTPPQINLGDELGNITGVVGYSFGNFEINVTEAFEVEVPTANVAEVTQISGADDRLTVATYNVLNITANASDGDADQIATLGTHIATNLGSPDIIALQEIQDDSGVIDDGTLTADATLQAIVDAIAAAGGPTYSFTSAVVDVDGESGGVPGGNIRNAFLYNTDRVDAVGFQTLESNVLSSLGVTNPAAFDGTRDPLLGTFLFNGEEITLINNHFSSRSGSDPIFGAQQPFNQGGEDVREQQAFAINEVVDALLARDADARISVLGDLNTFEFTDELAEDLPGTGEGRVLTNLIGTATQDDAYSFVFEGNAQLIDHIYASDSLLDGAQIDVVHINNDFFEFVSDHEPIVASFRISPQPLVEDMVLFGTRGRDILAGDSGDDLIFGRDGRDNLSGLGGSDTIIGGNGNDEIYGGAGDDVLRGNNGRDEMVGGAGDDTLNGGNGHDEMEGGEGDDILNGLNGGDHISGGNGNDIIRGGNGRDEMEGGEGNDTLNGGDGRDSISGGNGDDIVRGGNGRDEMEGGEGDDTLDGGNGSDNIMGGNGSDIIRGGNGRDTIEGGLGDDLMFGGDGRDRFVFDGMFGDDVIRDFSVRQDDLVFLNIDSTDVTFERDGRHLYITANGEQTFGTIQLIGVDALNDNPFSFV
jgi:2',3'-cyclic-nucleotide 2'-phosphodiesterase (5'-nucleotidase family)/predicted extracellular nuclease